MVRRGEMCAARDVPEGESVAWDARKDNLRSVRKLGRRKENERAVCYLFVRDAGVLCFGYQCTRNDYEWC